MADTTLSQFIEATKEKGASDEFLAALLTRAGWPQEEVYQTLGSYWARVTGVPMPVKTTKGESSRDAFLYLLAFATLATWSSALGSILFAFIDHTFPDPLQGMHLYNPRLQVTWQLASLLVAFPIFLVIMSSILREASHSPQRLESGVRKWLTYIALLLTAGGVICDLIWFLDYFLQGELTIRFVLKAAAVLLICVAIFIYYLGSLRWDRTTDVRQAKVRSLRFGGVAGIVVVTSFCLGLALTGTPARQRSFEADKRRVQDLQNIARSVHFWWAQHKSEGAEQMPSSLVQVASARETDPQTKAPYKYTLKTPPMYELCGNFDAASSELDMPKNSFWQHGQGETCFTLDASEVPAWP